MRVLIKQPRFACSAVTARGRPGPRWATASVEFAIVGPIFLMFIFGIIEIGRALMITEELNRAAVEGARTASASGSTAQDVKNTVDAILKNDLLTDSSGNSLGTVYISDAGTQVYPSGSTSASSITFTSGDSVRVDVYVAINKVTWLPIQGFLSKNGLVNLEGTATLVAE